MQDFRNKTALVTGGATSLGAAIATAFHVAGADVAIVDVNAEAGEKLAGALNAAAGERGGRALFCKADVSSDKDIEACLHAVRAEFGALDCLVNNACVYLDHGLASTREQWLRALDVNVVSGAILVHRAQPLLRRGGAIVNLSSIAGKIGQKGRALYPACKAAILQVTRNEAASLAHLGIRVNAVTPAWTWSAALEGQVGGDRALADRVGAHFHPLGRVGDAGDVARAVLYLCSEDAGFVTGVDLPVDGGYSMLGPDQGEGSGYWFQKLQA
jgi:NAD(P)-dependent dehydrogenase (short-subunit alcohol dehydrogenase family)